MLRRYFIPLILVLAAVAVAVFIASGNTTKLRDVRAAVPVEHFKLSNGLTVVVMPNTRLPIVTHMMVVKAGAADDDYGQSGMAHYLEHLMFTGTKSYPEGVYERSIARIGGTQNAFTTRDYTLYYSTVPKEHLSSVMAMEADRMVNIEFEPTRAAREVKVITEERNMRVDNNPLSQLAEQLNALTFLNHPYRQPTIGWAEDIVAFTPAGARAFHEKYYRASNMVLVVAGDVTTRDMRRHAQRYYGAMVAGAAPVRAWPKEPPVRMTRHGEMRDVKVNEPRLIRQYVAPSAKDGEVSKAMPLAVFAHYLGGGDTSLLYRKLVREQQLASSVAAQYDPLSLGPSLLRIVAVPASGVALNQLEQALDRELEAATRAIPVESDIQRAKTLLKAEVIYAQDGLQSLATLMAGLYALGLDEQYFYGWAESIDAVDATAALAAAKSVVVPNRKVTGYLLPEPTAPTIPVTAPAAARTEAPHAP